MRRLVGLELRPIGFAFVGGVIDRVLARLGSVRISRESDLLSMAGPNGVSFVGDAGRLLSLGFGLPRGGAMSTCTLFLFAFARAIFSIQLGCAGLEGDALGESGLANALSIQLDLFGLNRFDGLPKGDLRPPSWSAEVLYVEWTDLLLLWLREGNVCLNDASSCVRVTKVVRLLLLELGLEFGSWLLSRPLASTGSSFGMLYDPWRPLSPLRALAEESCLCSPPSGCALQRLVWLSERFIKALWTKPPIPLVGDDGRSLVLVRRAWDADIVGVRPRVGGSLVSVVTEDLVDCVRKGRSLLAFPSEIEGVPEDLALHARSSRIEPNLDGVSDETLSGAGLVVRSSFRGLSFDIPGNPLRAAKTSSPPLVSSLLFLNAALPTPLSAVCLKYVGSRAPRDAAICSREGCGSSTETSRVCLGAAMDMGLLFGAIALNRSRGACGSSVEVSREGDGAAIDMGLLPRGVGLCCHFMVFEREGIAALGEGFAASCDASSVRDTDAGVDGALPRLIEPKPLNSGTSTEARCGGSSLAMLLDMLSNTMAEPRGANGIGEPNAARVLLGVCTLLASSLF